MAQQQQQLVGAVPQLEWHDVLDRVRWRQGEHVTLIGPTGAGKTTAAMSLLGQRERAGGSIVATVTKPIDPIPDQLQNRGYERMGELPRSLRGKPGLPSRRQRVVLWPQYRGPHDRPEQTRVLREALEAVFKDGSWCVYIDELFWASNRLKLDNWLGDLWLQGRSMGVTLVVSSQRPRHVPLEAYSNSSHLLIWRTNDDEDLRRLSGMGAAPNAVVRDAVQSLDFHAHEVLWVDTRAGDLYITRAPAPES